MDKKLNAQMWLGVVIALAGIALLFWGLITPPGGVIDPSVLVGFGEVATFAGSLIGVDYHYKFREYETRLKNE
jgi:drug/metabolite transporter (DMT)-like permease